MIHQERAGDQFKSTSFTNESVPRQTKRKKNVEKENTRELRVWDATSNILIFEVVQERSIFLSISGRGSHSK